MERVAGIGGVFFRARDPESLGTWYLVNLGINLPPADYSEPPWEQEAGPTVLSPFPSASEYFGNPDQKWMVNFRVYDLDAMVLQLRKGGVKVDVDPKSYPNGRFARLSDPEGNPIELWQPHRPAPPPP
jgi:glyoxylase I family protein